MHRRITPEGQLFIASTFVGLVWKYFRRTLRENDKKNHNQPISG